MIPKTLELFTQQLEMVIKDNLKAVVLVGSFARGDQTNQSDIDLFVLVNKIDTGLLETIGEINRAIDSPNEINPAIVTLAEYKKTPDLFDFHKVDLDGVLIYGELPTGVSPKNTVLDLAKTIAQEVLMSSRHYIAVAEPEEKFKSGKLYTWNLKPLSFALRYYHHYMNSVYLKSYKDLVQVYPVLGLDPIKDHKEIILGCIELCEEVINA